MHHVFRLAAAAFLATALWAAPGQAQSLDALRASGVVAERYDGQVVLRQPNAAPDVRALVERVNAERVRIYAQRAREQNVPADQVGRVYAAEIMQKAPAGTWFLGEGGSYVRK
jgi:uncharacterized protein YdbL (DUF1318 family)